MQPGDAELVRRARRGDEAACHEIVELYSASLYRFAYSLVGNAADAEDVLQETFSGAFRGLSGFKERASLKTWLSGILVRQAARCHRSRARHKTASLDAMQENPAGGRSDVMAAPRGSDGGMKMDIFETLQQLSADHREVIVLREMQGLSYEEIAGTLGVPRGTVESRLFRARQELKELLKEYLP